MLLTYESRHVGDIAVVTCRGSIAEGKELAALQRYAGDLLRETAYIVADLGAVDFIDSDGVGLLVRLHTKARSAGGDLKLCALPARIAEVLRMTHLITIFGTYSTQAEAIAACYEAAPSSQPLVTLKTNVLCVDGSPDVLAYVRELLKGAGYGVLTVTNIADAVVLSTATRPKLVVISAALRSTSAAQVFTNSGGGARGPAVIELPPEFSRHEAGHAAQDLLERVRSAMAALG
jgi:anti-sigma B factor antagonist